MFVNLSDAHFYAKRGDLPKRIMDASVGRDVRGVSRGKRRPVMTCHAAPGLRHDHRAGGKIPELVGKLDHSVKDSFGDMGEVARG